MRSANKAEADPRARRDAVRAFLRGRDPALVATGYNAHRLPNREELNIRLRIDYGDVRQLRAQSVGLNAAGGYLQYANFEDALEIALLFYEPFRFFATVSRVETGGDTHHPTVNDTAQIGQIIPENAQISTADVAQFGQAVFRPRKYSSGFLLLPNELAEDAGGSLDLWLGRLIGQRIGRIQSRDWTSRVLLPGATQAATAGSHTAIAYADILGLEYAVDPAYRQMPTCGWMCHNNVRQSLVSLNTSTGNPIFLPRRRPDENDYLDGYPVTYNSYLPSTLAAGNQCLFFGDWSRIHIRDVRETRIVRLTERFAESDQVAVGGILRSDCVLLDAGTHPIQYLLQ